MDFLNMAKKRYSVRSFKNDPIPDEVINKILEAGRIAPTACNRQPQKILVVKSEASLALLRKCTHCHYNAPLAIIICYDKSQTWIRSYDAHSSGEVDASIVTTHMMLEAEYLGVGSTWVMYFIPEAVKTEFHLHSNLEPVAILVMGYPNENSEPSQMHEERKNIENTVEFI